MHLPEGKIEDKVNPVLSKLYKFLKESKMLPTNTEMWNAGVIGMSYKDKELLKEVLNLTDTMYPSYPKHIVEQLAFSYIFQKQREILQSDNYIYHYWNFKEFRGILNDFFSKHKGKSVDELIKLTSKISPQVLGKPKSDYQQQPGWKKILRKLSGKKWKMPDYSL